MKHFFHNGRDIRSCRAAVWPNGPSPALRARVRHAVKLYNEGRAPCLIMSGGMGEYPPTEAEAMAALFVFYLNKQLKRLGLCEVNRVFLTAYFRH